MNNKYRRLLNSYTKDKLAGRWCLSRLALDFKPTNTCDIVVCHDFNPSVNYLRDLFFGTFDMEEINNFVSLILLDYKVKGERLPLYISLNCVSDQGDRGKISTTKFTFTFDITLDVTKPLNSLLEDLPLFLASYDKSSVSSFIINHRLSCGI